MSSISDTAARDKAIAMVAMGADPDRNNMFSDNTDRNYIASLRIEAANHHWSKASVWNAIWAAEQYIRTWDQDKKVKAEQQAKYDAELAASRKAFANAINPTENKPSEQPKNKFNIFIAAGIILGIATVLKLKNRN